VRLFVLFILLLCPRFASAEKSESVFRDPIDFVRKKLLEARVGPGYLAYENIRALGAQPTGTHKGPAALYDLRIGPVNITNIFDQAGFTRGKGPRIGLLFNYTGDEYETKGLAKREKSLFAGGFVGWGYLTFYGYSDVLGKKAGVIYAAHFAPLLFRICKTEFFLVTELEHMNRLYVDYYFGIRAWEATTQLPTYDGRATNNVSATLLYVWSITKSLEFLLWGGEKQYGVGVTNSPTVGLKHEYRTGTGLMLKIL